MRIDGVPLSSTQVCCEMGYPVTVCWCTLFLDFYKYDGDPFSLQRGFEFQQMT